MKSAVERNPLGLAIGGAAVGVLAGLLAPSTRAEDKRIGQLADDVKSTAAEAGREAIERGKHVAQEDSQTAIETAKERGQEESEELTASLEGKARELSYSSQESSSAASGSTLSASRSQARVRRPGRTVSSPGSR